MVLSNPNNGEPNASRPNLQFLNHGDNFDTHEAHRLSEEIDSTCSTPYVSAPSSPGRGPAAPSGYFFSAPASPMHFVLTTAPSSPSVSAFLSSESSNVSGSFDFAFSSRLSPSGSAGNGSMSSADELFLNGQIRPMKLSSHLQRPQILAPLLDLDVEDEDEDEEEIGNRKDSKCEKRGEFVTRGRDLKLRNRSVHRKARSMSPLRTSQFQWRDYEDENAVGEDRDVIEMDDSENKQTDTPSIETTPSCSASSSRSSSTGRNSKKWIFLKDLLYRSKSEGRDYNREKFWSSISFSPAKGKKLSSPSLTPSSSRDEKEKSSTPTETQKQRSSKQVPAKKPVAGKPANGVSKRRVPPSPHELHYAANRAQAEEMKKKTFLPYRQGLLGCLGFSSKGYGALNGLTRTLNPVSSR